MSMGVFLFYWFLFIIFSTLANILIIGVSEGFATIKEDGGSFVLLYFIITGLLSFKWTNILLVYNPPILLAIQIFMTLNYYHEIKLNTLRLPKSL